ncbi:MAG: ferritin family protein [Gammaproteobacteria bacterium]|nr:ferritin family protein [Gammaproteobacteria bacterium]MCP5137735.1 ferritin family protein [Gammaproteobacteria bacterium]
MSREGHSSSYQRLAGTRSLQEILEIATEFERTARDFYTALAPRVSKRIRWLVEELADEEQAHFDLFDGLIKRMDLAEHIADRIATPASDHRFSDAIHLPDLGENPDDQAVLQYAMGREHAAMDQYGALAESVEPEELRALFRFLANEETEHKRELEARYYEIVHSGGV